MMGTSAILAESEAATVSEVQSSRTRSMSEQQVIQQSWKDGRTKTGGILALLLLALCTTASPEERVAEPATAQRCINEGGGFLRARLSGAINMDLSWSNDGMSCAGSLRPGASGLRLQFSRPRVLGENSLVLVFGIPNLAEGQSARAVPVNVTLIREGTGEFYGTQGEGKCTLDDLRQEPIAGIPLKSRAYRVVARGFCMQPARAVSGNGLVLMSRFDFAGRIDIPTENVSAPVSASGHD